MTSPALAPLLYTPNNRALLTLSGHEMTPASRAAGTQGDGLTGPYAGSSIGVWEATTNLVTNGGFETNTTGWSKGGTNTVARVAAASEGIPKMFGDYVGKFTYQDDRQIALYNITLTAAAHSFGVHVYVPTNYDGTGLILDASGYVGSTQPSATSVDLTKRDQWQWVKFEGLTPAGGDLAGSLLVYNGSTLPTAGRFIYIDGAQVEAQPLATPYVHTDGGTASRSAARPQISSTIIKRFINESQGWVAMRWKMHWASAALATISTGDPRFFWWGVNDDRLALSPTATVIGMLSDTGVNRAADQAGTFAAEEEITVIGAWVPATVYASLNGAAPATGARNSEIPDIGEDFFFGSTGASGEADATLLFMAMGKGTLSSANYAALNNIARNNRIDSRLEDLPGGATFKWPPPDNNWREGLTP